MPVRIVVEGENCYKIPLTGRRAQEGETFIIDAETWDDLRARNVLPATWTIKGGGRGYVATTSKLSVSTDTGLQPNTPRYLARMATGARDDQVVLFRNHNPRDLRLQNLHVVDWNEGLDMPSKRGWKKRNKAN